jgi:hypothetical protein
VRAPIKDPEKLAGRRQELKDIEYYFRLTAADQNPHLALIGERGSGKTSLLNVAEAIAQKNKLLTLRLDLDEQKVESMGRFWTSFYSALCSQAAKAGCWGGERGPIYQALLQMLHTNTVPDDAMAVLTFPMVRASHTGTPADLDCADEVIVDDLDHLIHDSLKERGLQGLVVLIDEADCLGQNKPLLQKLRNVFQRLSGASLVLAGTNNIFPTMEEVFSPMPRQFHQIEVRPFSNLFDTFRMVQSPLADKDLRPALGQIESLHRICGGDPSVVQLYCHNMYRLMIEERKAKQMSLHPDVFKAVLSEFRTNTSEDNLRVLDALDHLPDRVLLHSPWLCARRLTSDEWEKLGHLVSGLKDGRKATPAAREELAERIKDSLRILFEAGITTTADRFQLKGEPVTSSYWTSLTEQRNEKEWQWSDGSWSEEAITLVEDGFVGDPKLNGMRPSKDVEDTEASEQSFHAALNRIRTGQPLGDVDYAEISIGSQVIHFARQAKCKKMREVLINITCKRTVTYHLVAAFHFKGTDSALTKYVNKWIEQRASVLAEADITVTTIKVHSCRLPTNAEMWRLAAACDFSLPKEWYGPSSREQAVKHFQSEDLPKAIASFRESMQDGHNEQERNNLGYCLILNKDYDEASQMFEALLKEESPDAFAQHNAGVLSFLRSKKRAAKSQLIAGLETLKSHSNPEYGDSNVAMLLIVPGTVTVRSVDDIPLRSALQLNLTAVEEGDYAGALAQVKKDFPDRYCSEWEVSEEFAS